MEGDSDGDVGAGKTGAVTSAMRGFLEPARNRRPDITAAVAGVAGPRVTASASGSSEGICAPCMRLAHSMPCGSAVNWSHLSVVRIGRVRNGEAGA